MDLLVVTIDQLGRFTDTIRAVLCDRFEELPILRTEEPTELCVRAEVEDWLRVIEYFTFFSRLDSSSRSLIEAVTVADGDFKRGHGWFLLVASYSGQPHETGDSASTSCMNRS